MSLDKVRKDELLRSGMKEKPYSAEYKFKVAIEALKGEKTTAELCQEYDVVSSQIFKWKRGLLKNGAEVFAKVLPNKSAQDQEVEKLHATIGRLTVENDFLAKVLGKSR